MKRLLTLMSGLLLLAGLLAPLHAQEAEDTPTAEEEQVAEPFSIPDLLKEVKFVTKVKPKKATVYFFLRSHSACGPCQAVIGPMNNLYKEMKGKGAEIIMLNGDPDTEAAKKWADEKGIEFPMITPETASVIGTHVPGGGSGGTPNVMAVMTDATQMEGTSGYSKCPTLVGNWKDMIKDARKAEKEKKAAQRKAKKSKKSKKKKSKKSSSDEL